jgi:hypothetical protein
VIRGDHGTTTGYPWGYDPADGTGPTAERTPMSQSPAAGLPDHDDEVHGHGSRRYIAFAVVFAIAVLSFAAISIAVVTNTP